MATTTDAPLLEREDELARMRAALDDARDGQGGLVVIEGVAGSGKSALTAAAIDQAAAQGMRVLRAGCSELEREFAFGAIRQLFEPVLVGASPEDRGRLLAGAAAPAAWVLDHDDGGDPRLGAELVALHAIYWLAANLADDAPLLIVVDDLHWADESSVRSLSYLAHRLLDVPIALLLATRPDEPGAPAALIDELRGQAGDALIAPRPLTPDAVGAVVRCRLGDADQAVCAAFHDSSAGNPLYLQELLRTVGVEHPRSPAAVREASIPTLGDRVMRRVQRVAPEAPALAMAMAVLGDGGALAAAAALAGLDETTASRLAHRLVRIDVLSREDPFAFVHPLVRRSVYDAIPIAERDARHLSAAELLRADGAPAEAIAPHLAGLRPAGSSDVARTMARAAETALARAAAPAAIHALRRALDEEAAEPPRGELLHALGEAEMAVRDPAAADHLAEALALAPDPGRRARIAVTLVELLQAAGQWDAAIDLMRTAGEELQGADPDVALELEAVRALAFAYDPRFVETFDRERERLTALAHRDGWAAAALAATLGAVLASRGESADTARALAERSLRNGLLDRNAGGWAAAQVLMALGTAGDHDRALQVARAVEAAGRESGSLVGIITGVGYQGALRVARGDLAEAEARMRAPMEVVRESRMTLWLGSAAFFYVDAIVERPTLDDVAALIEALGAPLDGQITAGSSMLLEARGRVRRMRGDRDGAIRDLRAGVRTSRALGFGAAYSPVRSELALALGPEARDEAVALIEEELASARQVGLARPIGVALRAAGIVDGGPDGLAQLQDSVSVLEPSAARLEHARSLVALGAAMRRANRRMEARGPLAAGMELAHRCGAVRLVARADEELRAAGARPRRAARHGPDALTAAELRVARLAAAGRSNAEIAQELYVSRKTVETHLAHIYGKLGLSGAAARRGLVDALREDAA